MGNQYTYDAFISYRHTDLDMFVAENLHKYMESFKLPKNVIKNQKITKTKIERVFRDQEELPLTNNLEDPIMQALYNSEYLVVICSPRLKESLWCKKEIQTFIQYHGRENIFAVLVEGEPEESFPEELLYMDEYYYDEQGNQQIRRRNIEPLAADVRGNTKKEILKKLKLEGMRLLAPMFGVHFDDLRQRHRERKMRKVFAASLGVSIFGILIGVASTVAALRINKQKQQIEEQAVEIQAQADEIIAQSEEIQSQYDQLLLNQAKTLARDSKDLLEDGDRMGALETALQAITEYEDIPMPYTPEAQLALTESLGVYDNGIVFKPVNKIDTYGLANYVTVSPNGRYAAISDKSGCISIWDTLEHKRMGELLGYDYYGITSDICFVDDDTLAAYIGGDVVIYQVSTASTIKLISMSKTVDSINAAPNGDYIAFTCGSQIFIHNTSDYSLIHTIEAEPSYMMGNKCYFTEDNKLIYSYRFDYMDTNVLPCKFMFFDLNTMETYATLELPAENVSAVEIKDNICYVTATNSGLLANESGCFVAAIDINAGKVIWENNLGDVYPFTIELSSNPEKKEMLICSYTHIHILDYSTGTIMCDHDSGGVIIAGMNFEYTGEFLVLTETGEFYLCNGELSTMEDVSYLIDNKEERIQDFDWCQGGYIVVPIEDDRVTIYDQIINPDRQALEDGVDIENIDEIDLEQIDWQKNLLQPEEYIAMAEELGLEKSALVSTLVYSEDESVAFVTYADSTIEVVDVATLEVLETIEDAEGATVTYLGTDDLGNHYVSGADFIVGTFGYCFNSDYQLIAIIDNLIGIDSENERYIIGESELALYSIPMYSLEELIQLAKETIQ